MGAKTRVIIVDDHQVFADALSMRLSAEPDLEVVAVANDKVSALRAIDLRNPDVVVVDVELVDERDGLDLVADVMDSHPDALVVVVTAHDDPPTAVRAVRAGARAFVPKDTPSDEVVGVVRAVMAGETRVPPRLLTEVLDRLRRSTAEPNEWQERVARLTAREREVLELMVAGMDRASIAEALYLSINTVRTHNKNILAKLEVHSSLEAVSVALRAGLRPNGAKRAPG